jgi:hypothetical protein
MKPIDPSHPVRERRGYLYGDATTRRAGGIEHASKFGTDLAMRSATPPPAEAYDDWLRGRNIRHYGGVHGVQKTGFRLRRIVIMRRAGSSWAECGAALGITHSAAKNWVEFLPHELGV